MLVVDHLARETEQLGGERRGGARRAVVRHECADELQQYEVMRLQQPLEEVPHPSLRGEGVRRAARRGEVDGESRQLRRQLRVRAGQHMLAQRDGDVRLR